MPLKTILKHNRVYSATSEPNLSMLPVDSGKFSPKFTSIRVLVKVEGVDYLAFGRYNFEYNYWIIEGFTGDYKVTKFLIPKL